LPIIASFSYSYISQGSVVRWDIFNNNVIANFPQNVAVKEF